MFNATAARQIISIQSPRAFTSYRQFPSAIFIARSLLSNK